MTREKCISLIREQRQQPSNPIASVLGRHALGHRVCVVRNLVSGFHPRPGVRGHRAGPTVRGSFIVSHRAHHGTQSAGIPDAVSSCGHALPLRGRNGHQHVGVRAGFHGRAYPVQRPTRRCDVAHRHRRKHVSTVSAADSAAVARSTGATCTRTRDDAPGRQSDSRTGTGWDDARTREIGGA